MYDVIIIGGGLAGCAAAIASARNGASTLLVERYGCLGGWATVGLVNPFMSYKTSTGEVLVGGIFTELLGELQKENGLLGNCFDPEVMKNVLQEMVLESGAEMLLHTEFESASYNEDKSLNIFLKLRSKHKTFHCNKLIDCSGDGEAAVSLGAKYMAGDEKSKVQAVTLIFDMAGVDVEKALNYVKENPDEMRFPKLSSDTDIKELSKEVYAVAGYYSLIKSARDSGEYNTPGDIIFYISRPKFGEVTFNTTHFGNINPTDSEFLTQAEIECRRQMINIQSFVNKHVPGFEKSYIIRSAHHVGVRESRRIIGEYIFSADDIINARKFDDAILKLAYWADIHHCSGKGYTKEEESDEIKEPPKGDYYEVPFRCLVPKNLPNVLVAGRCVSATQEGQGAIRIMPACIAMGEAAGTAAAFSLIGRGERILTQP